MSLQSELLKDSSKVRGAVGRPVPAVPGSPYRQPTTQRTLLSANFGPIVNPLQNGAKAANLLGRSVISAGDRLRDLIVPDALATLVTSPSWIPGIGGGSRIGVDEKGVTDKKVEGLKRELEEILSSSCPLCESVVAGLDKPFVVEGEVGSSWAL